MASKSKGDCYYCGVNLGKAAMEKHILEQHADYPDGEKCLLLKIEGAFDKNYWLYVDISPEKSLADIDKFLRRIWLECCGHMSAFYTPDMREIAKRRKLGTFSAGDRFLHHYDFGDTTETLVTVVGETKRQPRRKVVRVLSRNTPTTYKCTDCGEEALYFSADPALENAYYCEECAEKHDSDDFLLPVTNSPRMGQCGYDGEQDDMEFPAWKFAK